MDGDFLQEISEAVKNQLAPVQQKHFTAIQWLYSETARGTGRTYLIAAVMVVEAIKNPQLRIRFHDHYPGPYSYEMLRGAIEKVIYRLGEESQFKEMVKMLSVDRDSLVFKYEPAIQNIKFLGR